MSMPKGQDFKKNLFQNNSSCDLSVFIYCTCLKGIVTLKKKFTESLIPWVHPVTFMELLMCWEPINLDP